MDFGAIINLIGTDEAISIFISLVFKMILQIGLRFESVQLTNFVIVNLLSSPTVSANIFCQLSSYSFVLNPKLQV